MPVLLRSCRYKTVRALASAQWGHDPERDGPVAMADDVNGAIVRVTDALMTVLDGRAVTGGADDVLPPPISRIEDGWGERETVPGVAVPGVVAVGDRPGPIDAVPQAPPGFVERDELGDLRTLLLRAGEGGLTIAGTGLGLHGQGGIGKSVLAAALARDEVVRRAFPDGIYWVTVGEHPDLVAAQLQLLARLGAAAYGVRSTLDGANALRAALAERRVLVVVDDVWSAAAAQAFDVTGAAGRVLYTTRDPATLRAVRAVVRRIDVLGDEAARGLLAGLSDVSVDELPADVDRVLTATGNVALALALVAAAVGRGGRGWREVADELKAAEGTFLQHPYANVFKALGVAVGALDAALVAAHESLAVFPEDTRVPVGAVARLWARLYNLTLEQTRGRLSLLAERELIGLDADADAISLHDLQRDFLLLRTHSVGLLHHELLAAYRSLLPAPDSPWRGLPAAEPYIGEHLLEHLLAAGELGAATHLVTDLGWIAVRAFNDGPHGAERDLRRVATLAADDPAVAWMLDRVTRWGHLLGGHQRWRMSPRRCGRAPMIPPQASTRSAAGAARARRTDTMLGAARRRPCTTAGARGPYQPGRRVAFSPGGAILASAAGDGTVRLWNAASGAGGRVLDGHTDWVSGSRSPPTARQSPVPAPTGRCGCGTRRAALAATRSRVTPGG